MFLSSRLYSQATTIKSQAYCNSSKYQSLCMEDIKLDINFRSKLPNLGHISPLSSSYVGHIFPESLISLDFRSIDSFLVKFAQFFTPGPSLRILLLLYAQEDTQAILMPKNKKQRGIQIQIKIRTKNLLNHRAKATHLHHALASGHPYCNLNFHFSEGIPSCPRIMSKTDPPRTLWFPEQNYNLPIPLST